MVYLGDDPRKPHKNSEEVKTGKVGTSKGCIVKLLSHSEELGSQCSISQPQLFSVTSSSDKTARIFIYQLLLLRDS